MFGEVRQTLWNSAVLTTVPNCHLVHYSPTLTATREIRTNPLNSVTKIIAHVESFFKGTRRSGNFFFSALTGRRLKANTAVTLSVAADTSAQLYECWAFDDAG